MKLNTIILGCMITAYSLSSFASGSVIPVKQVAQESWWQNIFVGFEGGMGIQNGLDITPDYSNAGNNSLTFLILPLPARPFESIKSTAPVFGANIGYFFTPQFSLDLAYDHRGNFKYENSFFYPGTASIAMFSDDETITGLKSDAVMLNFKFYPKVNWGDFKPFIAAAPGIAFNNFGTYHAKNIFFHESAPFNYTMDGKRTTSFAWQVGAGANYEFNSNFSLTAGYRFVDLGKFKSEDTFHETIPNFSAQITPWYTDHFFVNEFYLGINYKFGP